MKDKKTIPYISPEVEIIMFSCDDIIRTSSELGDDPNIDTDW